MAIEFEAAAAIAVTAVTSILKGVAESDFVSDYGLKAAYALREWKTDMALDVIQAQLNRLLTHEEQEELGTLQWPEEVRLNPAIQKLKDHLRHQLLISPSRETVEVPVSELQQAIHD
jgi:hypothetical protein